MSDIPERAPRRIVPTAILLFVTLSSGCPYYGAAVSTTFRPPHSRPNNPVSGTGIYHVVGRNESLSDVAKAYGVDLQMLAKVNNLTRPYTVKAGARIFIPCAPRKRLIVPSQGPSAKRSRMQDFGGSLAWPVNGNVISEYGARNGVQYNGITIQAKEGTPVAAAADGLVGCVKTIGEYGKVVLIEHPGRLVTVYAHLKEVRVTNGQPVKRGQIIGTVGTSGRGTGSISLLRGPFPFQASKPDFIPRPGSVSLPREHGGTDSVRGHDLGQAGSRDGLPVSGAQGSRSRMDLHSVFIVSVA